MDQLTARKPRHETSASMEAFFLSLLLQPLVTEERHTAQLLGGYFYKGLMQTKAGRVGLANYYFEKGEHYAGTLARESYLWLVVQDDYLPKKAYYFHKTGQKDLAEDMVKEAMDTMKTLEQMGFEHLLFGRVQQYHNLARLYFTYGQTSDAIVISAELVAFLLSGYSEKLADLNVPLHKHPEKYALMNYLFIGQVLFETLGVILKFSNRDSFVFNSRAFLEPVLKAVNSYEPADLDEAVLKQYISLFTFFYRQEYTRFYQEASLFDADNPGFFPGSRKTLRDYAVYFT
jgi:hypothetical protein